MSGPMKLEATRNLKKPKKKGLLDDVMDAYRWIISKPESKPPRSGQKYQNTQLKKLEKERF